MYTMQYTLVNTMQSGSMFGEMGLIYDRARGSTCIALGENELAIMNKKNFEICYSEFQKMEEKKKRVYIENNIIVEKELKFLAPKIGIMFEKKMLKRGNFICKQGKPSDIVYFVINGSLGLRYSWNYIYDKSPLASVIRTPNKASKKTEFFSYISSGEIVGEECLYGDKTEMEYDVITMTDCDFYFIEIDKLKHLCEENEFINSIFERNVALKLKIIEQNMKCFKEVKNYNGVGMFKKHGRAMLKEIETAKFSNLLVKKSQSPPLYKFKMATVDHTKSRVDRLLECEKEKIFEEESELSKTKVQMVSESDPEFNNKHTPGKIVAPSVPNSNQNGTPVSQSMLVKKLYATSPRQSDLQMKKRMYMELTKDVNKKKILVNKKAFDQREKLRKKYYRNPLDDIKDYKKETQKRKKRAEIRNNAGVRTFSKDYRPYKDMLDKCYTEPEQIVRMLIPSWMPSARLSIKKAQTTQKRHTQPQEAKEAVDLTSFDHRQNDSLSHIHPPLSQKFRTHRDRLYKKAVTSSDVPNIGEEGQVVSQINRKETMELSEQNINEMKEITKKLSTFNKSLKKKREKAKSVRARNPKGARSLQELKWMKDQEMFKAVKKARKHSSGRREMMKKKMDFYLDLKRSMGNVNKSRKRIDGIIRKGKSRSRRYGDDFFGNIGADDKFRFATYQNEKN